MYIHLNYTVRIVYPLEMKWNSVVQNFITYSMHCDWNRHHLYFVVSVLMNRVVFPIQTFQVQVFHLETVFSNLKIPTDIRILFDIWSVYGHCFDGRLQTLYSYYSQGSSCVTCSVVLPFLNDLDTALYYTFTHYCWTCHTIILLKKRCIWYYMMPLSRACKPCM